MKLPKLPKIAQSGHTGSYYTDTEMFHNGFSIIWVPQTSIILVRLH